MDKKDITAVIVDDELITKLDFTQMLAEMGIVVIGEASDGFDAVEICKIKQPDIVLMDIRMPVFDGIGATDIILRDDLARCVVIISAYNDETTIRQAIASGVSAYLIKPVDDRALFIAVQIALSTRDQMDRLRERLFQAEEALEDIKLIDRAKAKVASDSQISEAEAYRMIQKSAMDKQTPMRDIARHIVDANNDSLFLQRAKSHLMKRDGLSEKAAYRRILNLAEAKQINMRDAAREILAVSGS